MTKTDQVLAELPTIFADDYNALLHRLPELDESVLVAQHLTQIAWRKVIQSGVKVGNVRMFTASLYDYLPMLRETA